MTRSSTSRAQPVQPSTTPASLTHVELIWREKQIEHWIRFGREVQERILDRRRRILSFPAGAIFAFVRWAANDFGTILSRIDIVRAVGPGEPYQTLPFVRPGGEILLRLDGWPKVQRALAASDAVEALSTFATLMVGAVVLAHATNSRKKATKE